MIDSLFLLQILFLYDCPTKGKSSLLETYFLTMQSNDNGRSTQVVREVNGPNLLEVTDQFTIIPFPDRPHRRRRDCRPDLK
jgi:hypothetical protein